MDILKWPKVCGNAHYDTFLRSDDKADLDIGVIRLEFTSTNSTSPRYTTWDQLIDKLINWEAGGGGGW